MNILITEIVNQAIYFALFVGICVVGYHFLLKWELNLPQKKNNTGERFASQTKPIIGGTIFFISILIAYIYCTIKGISDGTLPSYTLLICCILAFAMGYIDDVKNFSPLFKLVFQILCAVIFIVNDTHIKTSDNIFLNYSLTIFWVVGLMNSINMLDNMDGITASISTIIFIGLATLSDGFNTEIILAVTASLIAFLIWNWHPAKMYMGDNGSQLLGVLLAYFSITYVWNSNDTILGFNYSQLIFICLMFIMPLIDTTTVAINRFLGGRSPFVGDRYHTTHCLVYIGLTIPQTVILLDCINAIGCAAAVYFINYSGGKLTHPEAIILASFFCVVFIIAYITNLIIRKKNNLLYKHG